MEFFLTSLIVAMGILLVFFIRSKVKRDDITLIEKEISQDFSHGFETDLDGSLTEQGMEDLVNWWSDNDNLNEARILKEIGDFK